MIIHDFVNTTRISPLSSVFGLTPGSAHRSPETLFDENKRRNLIFDASPYAPQGDCQAPFSPAFMQHVDKFELSQAWFQVAAHEV